MLEVEESFFDELLKKSPLRENESSTRKEKGPISDFLNKDRDKVNKNGDNRGAPGSAKLNSGRREGDTNIPPVIKEVIARTSIFEKGKEVAETFDIAPSTVNQIKNHEVNTERYLEKATEHASALLLGALGVITPEEIGCAPLKDKIMVADRLAGVVNKLGTRHGNGQVNQVILYKPETKQEADYDIIDVN